MQARAAAIAACLLLTTYPATAQGLQCGPRERVLEQLSAQEQTRRAMGRAGQAMMELFAEAEGERWVITVTLPDGRMCLLAHGVQFEMRDEVFPARGIRS